MVNKKAALVVGTLLETAQRLCFAWRQKPASFLV